MRHILTDAARPSVSPQTHGARGWRCHLSGAVAWAVLAGLLCSEVPPSKAATLVDFVTFEGGSLALELDTPVSVAVSPDGAHVYVTSTVSRSVTVFSRDAGTGLLSFVEAEIQGVDGVQGLGGTRAVAVSPDGAHVYVAGGNDDAVAVFARDGGTGSLTFVEAQFDGVGGVNGLAGARSVTVSPDGAHVYVAGPGDNAVAVFSRDGTTGALTFVEAQLDGIGGVVGLGAPLAVTVSPDGAHVYVTSVGDDAVAVFTRDGVTGALTFVEAQFDGVGGVDGLDGPIQVTVSPDGGHIYVASFFDHAVAVFGRDGVTGALTFVEAQINGVGGVNGLSGPESVAVSSDGAHVYVASQSDDAVVVFSRDGVTGALTFVEAEFNSVLDFVGSVTVSPDGGHVYATSPTVDAVVALSRDGVTGALTFVKAKRRTSSRVDGLDGPTSVALSPDGGHLYVASQGDHAVVVFSRDGATGALTFVEAQFDGIAGVDGLGGAWAVTVSPDGAHVYVASFQDRAVAVFSRDGVTGALTFVEAQFDGVGGVDGLDRAFSVTVSPDGAHVYVTGDSDDAVAVFSRDGVTGALTFVEAQLDGVAGVDGLDGARAATISPDGAHVYVGSFTDDAVAVFSRDGITGALTFVEAQLDGVAGVDGLEGAQAVTISPDGTHVYAAAPTDRAVAVFSRESGTGTLAFIEAEFDGVGGVDGLGFARSVAVSPDGEFIYVAASGDDAVAVLTLGFAGCSPTPAMNCRTAERGNLRLVDRSPDKRDAFAWTWIRGETTTAAEFDPGTSNHYALCVYDESQVLASLLLEAVVPATGDCGTPAQPRPCWNARTQSERTQFRYTDRWATPEGLRRMNLSESSPRFSAFIRLSGRGEHVGVPPLPLPLPVRAQLQSVTGGCWEGTFSSARTNTSMRFRAAADSE